MQDKSKNLDSNYWKVTENFKDYPKQPWDDSDDVACFGVCCDEGMTIMLPFEAAAFVSSNDIMSMIALRIPQVDWDRLYAMDDDDYSFEIKDSYFIDYKGKNLI